MGWRGKQNEGHSTLPARKWARSLEGCCQSSVGKKERGTLKNPHQAGSPSRKGRPRCNPALHLPRCAPKQPIPTATSPESLSLLPLQQPHTPLDRWSRQVARAMLERLGISASWNTAQHPPDILGSSFKGQTRRVRKQVPIKATIKLGGFFFSPNSSSSGSETLPSSVSTPLVLPALVHTAISPQHQCH